MRRRKLATFYLLLILFLTSCSYNKSFVKKSYDTLAVSKEAYNLTMKVLSNLDSKHLLNPVTKEEVIKYSTIYSIAHNEAVKNLAKYQETKSLEDEQRLKEQLEVVSNSLRKLLKLAKPYLEKL